MARVIPELELGRKLGNGFFGEVFLGQDGIHGEVAVKVLARKPNHSDDDWRRIRESFLAEARHLKRATHRNVVQVFSIEEHSDGNSIRFCMAYCPGGSLQAPYDAGPMTLAAVRKAGTEVLLGLAALHARQMLHRDIKPGNILLDAAGVAQLGDFGLVTDDLLLGYGSIQGYFDHSAYEIWHGRGTSVRSDIWALGMTLYRLLHGKAWYEESVRPREVVREGGFADRLSWLPHVPRSWRRVIRKMICDDTASRYASAGDAMSALARLPIEPAWTARVTPDLIRWELATRGRAKVVEWRRRSARQHEWLAWSEPTGAGRRMTLGGSNGLAGRQQVVRELERFFGV